MRLLAFRIKNFRSIVDSDWTPFSIDEITVLVGQNESGKTSVLDALDVALSTNNPNSDDCRIGAPLPEVHLKAEITFTELGEELGEIQPFETLAIQKYLKDISNQIELKVGWQKIVSASDVKWERTTTLADNKLDLILEDFTQSKLKNATTLAALSALTAASGTDSVNETEGETEFEPITSSLFAHAIWGSLPLTVMFNEETGRLPNVVDIDTTGQPTGTGAKAAMNFLKIAEIELPNLLKGDKRARENTLNRANSRVSQDFNTFWSQTIGKSDKLSLKCDLDNYDSKSGEAKAGKPHLVFWICDGNTQLYPKQRSQGVRWFLSFYLQLKASEKEKQKRVFLLDEPGANLHSKAQGDVLKLINQLAKDTSIVIYTTHSPQMIEHEKLFRIHAVQRDGELEDSPTKIIDAHRLGSASTDTLSPILNAMGADLSQHQVIKKSNNVLLEEMSGHYYLTAFWKLTETNKVAHFIAATGVNKLETLANMFRGWNLNFIVAVDDDKQGREVFNTLKRRLYADDDGTANKYLVKLPCGTGIEDVFSTEDFKKHVLNNETAEITGKNCDYLKTAGRSKPVMAYLFSLAVSEGKIKLTDLSKETQGNINATVESLTKILS
jgi:ABC-type lipoprotein export system ATPase subunit